MKRKFNMKFINEILKSELSNKQNERGQIRFINELATEREKKDYHRLTCEIMEIKEAINLINLNY